MPRSRRAPTASPTCCSARGVRDGARVFLLLGRRVELFEVVLGALRANAIVAALFTAFGPEPLKTRMQIGEAQVLVTTAALYRRKIAAWRAELPTLRTVLLLDEPTGPAAVPDAEDYESALAGVSDEYVAPATGAETPALLHFTSGTTGTPKGALHVHDAALMHFMTGRHALDLHADDVYWCTADPGWVTGMSYGVIAPLLHGVTSIVDEGEFDAERRRWYRILAEERVSVWYTAPTAIRMLMKAGPPPADCDLRALRLVASVGEPLNPEGVVVGPGRVRPAVSRQLVADGDRRDHDRQLRPAWTSARLDGPAVARRRRAAMVERDAAVRAAGARAAKVERRALRCGPAGPRCSAPTWGSPSAMRAASTASCT